MRTSNYYFSPTHILSQPLLQSEKPRIMQKHERSFYLKTTIIEKQLT